MTRVRSTEAEDAAIGGADDAIGGDKSKAARGIRLPMSRA